MLIHDVGSPNASVITKWGGGGGNIMLVGRYSDLNNYWVTYFSGTFIRFYKIEAGAATIVGSDEPYTLGAADTLEMRMSGNTIGAYVNGALETSITSAFNNTATEHGLRTIAVPGSNFNECQIG
jgi:hypothetical protein